jgi:hypothetical protein
MFKSVQDTEDIKKKGTTITGKFYIAHEHLYKLKQQLVSKHCNKLSKGILFLCDNTAPLKAAIMHQKWADLHFEVLKHPAYSPDLAPLIYHLFLNLKARKFLSNEVTLAADGWFAAHPKNFSWMG